MMRLANENQFNSLEKPKQIKILAEAFSPVGNEILTPTMKLKRNVAKTYFAKDIPELYELEPMKAT